MIPIWLKTTVLLVLSNVFMTFAWYAHLKNLHDRKWIVAAVVSWGIALFEYLLQVPANRIGYTAMSARLSGVNFVLSAPVVERNLNGEIRYVGTVVDTRIVGTVEGSATTPSNTVRYSGAFNATKQ